MRGVVGILLAGGAARRMGGADKPLLDLAGRPLIAHTLARLRPQCEALVISANGDPARFASFGLPVTADATPDFPGPLAGLLATLDHIAGSHPDTEFAVSLPADTPFVPEDLVERLVEARRASDAEIAMASSGERTHYAVALWPVAIRDALRAAFADGERSVGRFARRFRVATAQWPATPHDPFLNINTPADLAAAEAIIPSERRHASCG